MSLQKLPVFGSLFQNLVPVAGQVGVGALTPFTVVQPAATEVTISRFLLSGAAIVITGGVATVTLASHLNTILGQQVTFSGCTGAGAVLNNQTFTITNIASTSVYSFPTTAPDNAGVTGTIVQEPVFTLPPGISIVNLGANALVEYNSDNLYNNIAGQPVTAPVWKVLYTFSLKGLVVSDGWGVRMRCSGTTANSFYSPVN